MRWIALVALVLAAAPSATRGADDGHAVAPAPPRSFGGAPAVGAVPAPPRVPPSGGATPGSPGAPGITAAPGLHRAVPAPPRYGPWRGPSFYPYPYAYPYPYPYAPYYYDPFWFGFGPSWGWGVGWGWGWGPGWQYDVLYPSAPPPPYALPPPYAPPPGAPPKPTRITSRFDITGGPTLQHGGASAGLVLEIAGERFGFHGGIDGLYPGSSGYGFGGSTTYTYGTAHLTVALLSTERVRLRVELGGSVLSWPDVGPDAGLTAFGPDFGVAGRLHLVGPLGIEAYFRATPVPVPILDAQAALALRFGPVALTAGWRDFSVHKSDENASRFAFAGPQFGLGLRF